MANNRLWIVNTQTNKRVLLAKYYPSTGWYPWDMGALNALFAETDEYGMTGSNPWHLEYEHAEKA